MGCSQSATMVWKKNLSENKLALLLINNRNVTSDVSVSWKHDLPQPSLDCGAIGCKVRDIHSHKDLGHFKDGFTAEGLAPHDSAFIVVTGSSDAKDDVVI